MRSTNSEPLDDRPVEELLSATLARQANTVTAVRPDPEPVPDPAISPSAPSAPFTHTPTSSLPKCWPSTGRHP
jgi:hypothetical protein